MSFRLPSVPAIGAAALLVAALPATAAAGPPWIAVELPANPLNATTRGAFLLIRTYHHADAVSAPLTGRAIGMVDGRRRTVDLTIERTSVPGVHAVRRTWPDEGAWVLAIHLGEGTDGAATALIGIAADGEVRSVRVPTRTDGRHTWPRAASNDEIEGMLSSVSSLAAAPADEKSALDPLHALILLPVGLGAGLALRRGRSAPISANQRPAERSHRA